MHLTTRLCQMAQIRLHDLYLLIWLSLSLLPAALAMSRLLWMLPCLGCSRTTYTMGTTRALSPALSRAPPFRNRTHLNLNSARIFLSHGPNLAALCSTDNAASAGAMPGAKSLGHVNLSHEQ